MSDTWQPNYGNQNQSAGVTDVVTQLQGIVRQLTALVQAINGRTTFGTFTMPVAASLVVPNTAVKGNSVVSLSPTNISAGTLMGGARSLYISALSAGTSFTVATANAANAAGTETFTYTIETPT